MPPIRTGVELHRDASAQIRWRTLLGGSMYIDLSPGSPSAPLLNGPIPVGQTGTQVDWDQFNDQFVGATRSALRQTLGGFRQGLAAPRATAHTLATLGPALALAGRGLEPFRGQQIGEIPRLIETSATVATALSSGDGALGRLVDGAARTFAVTSQQRVALQQTVALSPPALASTTATMHQLDATLNELDPLVTRLRPGVRELAPAMDVLRPALLRTTTVLGDAVPLLTTARPAFSSLAAISSAGVPLIAGFTPVVRRLNNQLIPFLRRTDPDTHLRNYEAIAPAAAALDSAAGQHDGSSYALHFDSGTGGASSLLLPCDIGLQGAQLQQCSLANQVLGLVFAGGKP
jgi:phospholipid/cholesterol/gamma-HCH transport system substrate-binding protein